MLSLAELMVVTVSNPRRIDTFNPVSHLVTSLRTRRIEISRLVTTSQEILPADELRY